MTLKPIEIVLEILKEKYKSANIVDNNEIQWVDNNGEECYIYDEDIDIFSDKIAWAQSSDKENHILKIYTNSIEFQWKPIMHNLIFFHCISIRWYGESLLFIYREKHNIYICSIRNKTINHINFQGVELMINKSLLSYKEYDGIISLIKIPNLTKLGPISLNKAKELDLVPKHYEDIYYDDSIK